MKLVIPNLPSPGLMLEGDFQLFTVALKEYLKIQGHLFPCDDFEDLVSTLSLPSSILRLKSVLESTSHQNTSKAQILGIFLKMIDFDSEYFGEMWIALGKAYLFLYIPDVVWDPVSSNIAECKALQAEINNENANMWIEREYRFIASGATKSDNSQLLTQAIKEKLQIVENLQKTIALRPEASQLEEIFTELQKLDGLIRHESIDNLLNALKQESATGIESEYSLQSVLGSFLERMPIRFPMYKDFLQPVYLAVNHIRYGLKLAATVLSAFRRPKVDVAYLHAYSHRFDVDISIIWHSNLLQTCSNDEIRLQLQISFLKKLAAFSKVENGRMKHPGFVADVFASIADSWEISDALKAEKEAQDANMYKAMIHDDQDADFDEQEVDALLPSFAEEFLQEDDQESADESHTTEAFNAAACLLIVDLFGTFYGQADRKKGFSICWKDAYISAIDSTSSVNLKHNYQDGRNGDIQCGALVRAHEILEEISSASDCNESYDFYNHSNISEAKKIIPVLQNFDKIIGRCLEKWPEHTVLLRLQALALKLISLPVTSSIMKLLSGIEIILIQAEDWQKYCSKEYSLSSALSEFTTLIVSWRKLELNCWKQLLSIQEKKLAGNVSKMWLHLWLITRNAVHSKDQDISTDQLIQQLIGILNDYCISSAVGEFDTRLRLLRSFGTFTAETANTDDQALKVSTVIGNVVAYYSQYSQSVAEYLTNVRTPIEKELKEFVRIATWKDVNVFALKEAAKKTHYQLGKFIKRFSAGLATPVKEIIASHHENQKLGMSSRAEMQKDIRFLTESQSRFLTATSEILLTSYPGKRLRNISQIVLSSKKITQELMEVTDRLDTADMLEGLTEIILTRINGFQMNGTVSKEAEIKGQKMIRKKAWVDLLKKLSKVGLSSRCSQKYVTQQDSTFMNLQEVVDPTDIFSLYKFCNELGIDKLRALWSSADNYYFKFAARVQIVRKLKTAVSKDVSSIEVERSISYLDDLMHYFLMTRNQISKHSKAVAPLNHLLVQLNNMQISAVTEKLEISSVELSTLQNCVDSILTCAYQLQSAAHASKEEDLIEIRKELSDMVTMLESHKIKIDAYLAHYIGASVSFPPLICMELSEIFYAARSELITICNQVRNWIESTPSYFFMFKGIAEARIYVLGKLDTPPDETTNTSAETAIIKVESMIESAMLVVQSSMKRQDGSADDPQDIKTVMSEALRPFESDHINNFSGKVSAAFDTVSRLSSRDFGEGMQMLLACYPLLKQAIMIVNYRLYELIALNKSMTKFGYVLSNTFYTVIKNGFCLPETETDEEETGATGEDVAGMGIGEGEGKKDVSDEIENEDQVEGLKNDMQESADDQKEIKDEKEGIELSQDFDGKMEDLDAADESEEDKSDVDDDAEDKADEQMGDLDDDLASIVDEKLWDGSEDRDKTEDKQDDSNSNPKGDEENEDLAAKMDNTADPKGAEETAEKDNEARDQPYEDDEKEEINEESDLLEKSNGSTY